MGEAAVADGPGTGRGSAGPVTVGVVAAVILQAAAAHGAPVDIGATAEGEGKDGKDRHHCAVSKHEHSLQSSIRSRSPGVQSR